MEDDRRELTPAKAQYIPEDRFNLVYCIFYLLGIGSLMPWNFFITAKEYFQFKLRNTTLPVDYSVETVGSTTELQASFESYIAIASCVPNFLFNLLNAVSTNIIPLKVRMVVSLLIMLVMFAVTDGVVFVNTDTWQTNFFILTIATVVITSAATSVMGGALFGLSGQFPPRYTQAAMSGQAMGGTFAALADIFSLAGGSTVIDSAFGFFLSAVIVILASLIGFIALHYIDFSQFFMGKSPTGPLVHSINYSVVVDSETSSTDDQDESDANSTPPVTFRGSIGTVFKNVWPQAVAVLSVFAVTLSVFPGVCSAIQSNHRDSGSDLTNKYFSPLVCFLLFNTGDWAGRIVAGWIDLLRPDRPARLLAVTALRVCFVPLIMLCNAQPRSHLPIIFYSDFIPVIFISFLGLTNGYVSTLAMMHAPQKVSFQLAEVAGSWMAVFISGGLALGSLLSLGLVKLL